MLFSKQFVKVQFYMIGMVMMLIMFMMMTKDYRWRDTKWNQTNAYSVYPFFPNMHDAFLLQNKL